MRDSLQFTCLWWSGALTGNDKLREEGKTDQAVGKAKQVAEKAVDTVEQAAKELRQ